MFILFYKHFIDLYRSYSKSLCYFGSSPVDGNIIGIVSIKEFLNKLMLETGLQEGSLDRFQTVSTTTGHIYFTILYMSIFGKIVL